LPHCTWAKVEETITRGGGIVTDYLGHWNHRVLLGEGPKGKIITFLRGKGTKGPGLNQEKVNGKKKADGEKSSEKLENSDTKGARGAWKGLKGNDHASV